MENEPQPLTSADVGRWCANLLAQELGELDEQAQADIEDIEREESPEDALQLAIHTLLNYGVDYDAAWQAAKKAGLITSIE